MLGSKDWTLTDTVCFADDVLVITTCTQTCSMLLHLIEKVSAQFGLRLTRDKSSYTAVIGSSFITFEDDTRLGQ